MENEVEFDNGDVEAGEIDQHLIGDDLEEDVHPHSSEVGASFSVTSRIHRPDSDMSDLEPYEGMEFESEEAAKAFYNSYARRVGFSTRVSSSRRSRRDGAIIQRQFVCAKEGFRNLNEKRTKDREIKRPRIITRVGCKASLSVKMQDSGKWMVSAFVKRHNHELVSPEQVHCLRSHRQISGASKTLIDTLQAAGMGPRKIMSALIAEYGGINKVGFTEVDCRNYIRNNRHCSTVGDIHLLLDYLRQMHSESPEFFYAVQGDDEQPKGNVFWVDPNARMNYTYFGDAVTFDTTYRSNRYRLPFAPFTGVNHHGQPVLLGCAFLISETEASFVWLFRTWLASMSGRHPVSITTDHDEVIRNAILQVLPSSRHRICKWNVFRKCQENMAQTFLEHPNFEYDFHKCVNLTESVDEFESCWHALLDRYELLNNEWLQHIYSLRMQWVPVYTRDAFFAEMSVTQRSDTMNSYFDGYINASTNLCQFFKLYEKAIESRTEKEAKADYESMTSPAALKTPSPIERQASEHYTKKLFARFQEELVGTLTYMATEAEADEEYITYVVTKLGENHRAYRVKFNILELKASCSCHMFEFSGLLCRHVLAVFKMINVLTLPSHCFLPRWTKAAKRMVKLESSAIPVYNSYLESHAVRYNALKREALKLADAGCHSLRAYQLVMSSVRDAAKMVDIKLHNRDSSHSFNLNSNVDVISLPLSGSGQCLFEDPMDQECQQLSRKLERAKRICDNYRSNLISVLKDVEDQKIKLSVKVQNVQMVMKDPV